MEYRSRRERREAEKAGLVPPDDSVSQTSQAESETIDFEKPQENSNAEERKFPSRKELRKQAQQNLVASQQSPQTQNISAESNADESLNPAETEYVQDNQELHTESEATRKTDPEKAQEIESASDSNQSTGRNYLYQDSSNTLTMDNIPDSLEVTNGDLIVNNSESVEILTGSQPSLSSVMDDLKFDSEDQKDTVAGRISLVDPVSAKLVAESREPETVVPGKIVVRNRALSTTFAILGGVMFVLAGIGLWWALSEMGPFS